MKTISALLADTRRSRFVDLLRMYVGFALVARGVQLVSDPELLRELTQGASLPFASTALAHLVGVLHLGGGVLLAAGLLTRLAALAQIPAVLGALLFVHLHEGLASQSQGLQLSAFVLFSLIVVVVHGPGPWSADDGLDESYRAFMTAETGDAWAPAAE